MRVLSTVVRELLTSNNISTFYLVDVYFPAGHPIGITHLAVTSAAAPLIVEGVAYDANGGLLGVEPPRLSDVLDREPYKITFADPFFLKLNGMEKAWTGLSVRVRVGFFNTTSEAVGIYAIGKPILSSEHLIVAYKGRVDKPTYSIDPDSGSVIAQLECASPAAALGLIKSFYTSDQSMRAKHPTDSSFRDVHIGGEEAAIVWGKK